MVDNANTQAPTKAYLTEQATSWRDSAEFLELCAGVLMALSVVAFIGLSLTAQYAPSLVTNPRAGFTPYLLLGLAILGLVLASCQRASATDSTIQVIESEIQPADASAAQGE
jgi:hypothetical protein